ncbi:MAG: hypothetical protein ACOYLB_01240 [Phototrophicaceae bacterium]
MKHKIATMLAVLSIFAVALVLGIFTTYAQDNAQGDNYENCSTEPTHAPDA